MAITSEAPVSTLQTPEAERMEGLSRTVRLFTYHSVVGFDDPLEQFQAGVSLAKELGHDERFTAGGFGGVTLAGGPNAGKRYLPGIADYWPEDHVRGVTATILDSPLHPFDQSTLILRAVNATYATRPSRVQEILDGVSMPVDVGITERDARKVAQDELMAVRARTGTIGVESIAHDLSTVATILENEWHPHRAKVTAALLGVGTAAILAAIGIKRHQ